MILVGMTISDTLVMGFLVETSCMIAEDKILLIVLPEKMASSRRSGHLGKCLFVLCK
jgi:hypothetical protein